MTARQRLFGFLGALSFALAAALVLVMAMPGALCQSVYADFTGSTSDFCYRVTVTIENQTGGPITNRPVAFEADPASLIGGAFMNRYVWDLRPTTGALVNTDVEAQDTGSGTARWWIFVPSLADGATGTFYLYFGSAVAKRDQGIMFSGADEVLRAHHASFNVTDNLRITAEAETTLANTGGWILQHFDSGASDGYRLGIIDVAGVRKVRAQVDASTLDVPWSGALTDIRMDFIAPNLTLYFDGVSVGTLNTGLGGISTNTEDLKVGTDLSATVRDVVLLDNIDTTPAPLLHWGFNPVDMAETGAADPTYTGTVADESGNGFTGTYTFTRDQSDITPTTGDVTFLVANPSQSVTIPAQSILGGAVSGAFTTSNTISHIPFFSMLEDLRLAWEIPAPAWWFFWLTAIGLLVGVGVFLLFMRNAVGIGLGTLGPIVALIAGVAAGFPGVGKWMPILVGFVWFGIFSWLQLRRS